MKPVKRWVMPDKISLTNDLFQANPQAWNIADDFLTIAEPIRILRNDILNIIHEFQHAT